jgi:hypothetical protein
LRDNHSVQVADPDPAIVGKQDIVWVHRLLYARWTEDTRRLAG